MPSIHIEKLAFGGAGFGRIEGKACFVPYTAPGDLAEVELISEKKSYSTGVLKELKSPSSMRVSPPCPYFGDCGGCNWQHMDYVTQSDWKERIFTETMGRMAGIEADKIRPMLIAEEAFYYRQRIQLKVQYSNGIPALGFYRNNTHEVIDIQGECCIAAGILNSAIPELKSIIASSPEPEMIPQIDLAAGEDGLVAALFHYSGNSLDDFSSHLMGQSSKLSIINSLFVQSGGKKTFRYLFGSELLRYYLPDINGKKIELAYSVDTFSQINFSQNRALSAQLLQTLRQLEPETVLDIYCGNGNFSLPFASAVKKLVGIESSGKSVALARQNASMAGIDNAMFYSGDAESRFDTFAASGRKFDLLILDPPRSGAQNLVSKLGQLGSRHIIYISCDPVTLARDLETVQKSGFRVMTVQPVDMFPQTYHIESMTLLERI